MSYKFKKGDAVISKDFGLGRVSNNDNPGTYSIYVIFNNGIHYTYNAKGHGTTPFSPKTDESIRPATKLDKYLYEVDSENT